MKSCVTEPVPEFIKGIESGSFLVRTNAVAVFVVVGEKTVRVAGVGERKAPGRIELTGQQLVECFAAVWTGVPGMNDGMTVVVVRWRCWM